MVCLGAVTEFVYIPGGSAKPLKEIVHVLLAFSAIGTLESIRQNVSRHSVLDTLTQVLTRGSVKISSPPCFQASPLISELE